MNTMPFVEILDPLEKMFIKKNSKTNQQLMIENLIFAEKENSGQCLTDHKSETLQRFVRFLQSPATRFFVTQTRSVQSESC